jgi:hypothetical protein
MSGDDFSVQSVLLYAPSHGFYPIRKYKIASGIQTGTGVFNLQVEEINGFYD